MQEKNNSNDTQHAGSTQQFAAFVKWVTLSAQKELNALDHYTHKEIMDLVSKFKNIAQNAEMALEAMPDSRLEQKLMIDGKAYSYAQAAKELHRLIDMMIGEKDTPHTCSSIKEEISAITTAMQKFAQAHIPESSRSDKNLKAISHSIQDVIIALQFQDFFKQRLAHLDIILRALEQESDRFLSDTENFHTEIPLQMSSSLLDQFYLSHIKDTFEGVLAAEQSSRKCQQTQNIQKKSEVELF